MRYFKKSEQKTFKYRRKIMNRLIETKKRIIKKIKENVKKQKIISNIDENKLDLFSKRSIMKINTMDNSLLCMNKKERNIFTQNIKNSINQEIDDLYIEANAK